MGAESNENGAATGDDHIDQLVTKPGENDVLCGKLLVAPSSVVIFGSICCLELEVSLERPTLTPDIEKAFARPTAPCNDESLIGISSSLFSL
jgi:hypothetical protein